MTWIYKQATGELFDPSGMIIATGYAGGNCGANPEGRNNPDMQDVKCIGPLPEGTYVFGQPVMQSHLGPFAIPLIPDPSNTMYGRGDFYMHGDTQIAGNASEGCIIQARSVREACWASDDHVITVVRE